jgi:hypothetical protein
MRIYRCSLSTGERIVLDAAYGPVRGVAYSGLVSILSWNLSPELMTLVKRCAKPDLPWRWRPVASDFGMSPLKHPSEDIFDMAENAFG